MLRDITSGKQPGVPSTPRKSSMHTSQTSAVDGALHSLDNLSHRARSMAVDGAHAVRDNATHARDATSRYIQDRPLPSVLIAAGTGVALVLLAGLLVQLFRHRP
jgi:ElaB/YqjD/DUF883 family membrane-anchored ribosome-binding protein